MKRLLVILFAVVVVITATGCVGYGYGGYGGAGYGGYGAHGTVGGRYYGGGSNIRSFPPYHFGGGSYQQYRQAEAAFHRNATRQQQHLNNIYKGNDPGSFQRSFQPGGNRGPAQSVW